MQLRNKYIELRIHRSSPIAPRSLENLRYIYFKITSQRIFFVKVQIDRRNKTRASLKVKLMPHPLKVNVVSTSFKEVLPARYLEAAARET